MTDRPIVSESSVAPGILARRARPWRPAVVAPRPVRGRAGPGAVLGRLDVGEHKGDAGQDQDGLGHVFLRHHPDQDEDRPPPERQELRRVISSQAKGNPLAASAAAKVSAVTLTSATKATVRYTITIGGQPALANQKGVAVLQAGTWKVGDQSFCALFALEQTKTPACPSK